MGRNHELGGIVAAARMNADWLHRESIAPNAELDPVEVHAMSEELRGALDRLAEIVGESRRLSHELEARVALHDVHVGSCIARASQKLGNVAALVLEVPSNRHVLVRGGEKNLDRVLDTLFTKEATIRATDAPAGHVTIDITGKTSDLDEAMILVVAASGGGFVRTNEGASVILPRGGASSR
jgi:signal transduction histidine kinase